VLAAGIRPCSGAIILLVFTLSQGLFAAGVLGTVAMAIGTFITTGTLASLAVFARASAQKFAKLHGPMGARLLALFELLAAAFVLTLGIVLLTGAWSIAWPA
jgi:nickel/cobalt exporter